MNLRLILMSLLCLGAGSCGPITLVVGQAPGEQRLTSTVVEKDTHRTANRVAIIDISGLIYNHNKPGLLRQGENPVSLLHEKLEKARHNRRVKAVILRINSPGGTVTASDAAYRLIMRFKEKSKKPVVAILMDIAASGGYYTACAADHIVAYPTSITGSIGVIVQTVSLQPALAKFGITAEAITSGQNKDAGSLFSTLTPQQRKVIQKLVDDFYDRFVQVVRQARPSIMARHFTEATDGRILSGDEALKVGLVDQVGDLYDALTHAKRLSGISAADLLLYHRPLAYAGSPYATTPGANSGPVTTQINLAQFNITDTFAGSSLGFFYLLPGYAP